MKSIAFLFACAWSGVALAVPPAPVVAVHASGIKKLTFEWEPVTEATRYDLWFKANDNAAWTRYLQAPAPRSSLTIGVAVHLLHWPQARFQLKACDNSGCSTSNTVRVNSEKTVAMGYFKSETPGDQQHFGGNIALSADGSTMAVVSGEVINGNDNTAVIYVYRRTSASWRREVRLVPNSTQGGTAQYYLGEQVALSGDGNLLVFGAWQENRAGPTPVEATGAVYLFRRAGSTWRHSQKLVSQDGPSDYFGYMVKVDDAAQTLVIQHNYEGVEPTRGTLEVFRDEPGDGSDRFVHFIRVPVERAGETIVAGCESIALSGDGNTLLRVCGQGFPNSRYVQALAAPGFTETSRFAIVPANGVDVSYDGTRAVVDNDGAADTYRLTSDGWVSDGYLTSFGGVAAGGHRHVAISRDGRFVAIGSISDIAAGLGPIFEPYQTADDNSGGVILHERKPSGWVIRRLIKPGSTNQQWAGFTVALGDNGNVLAVGAPQDDSAAMGIDGDRDDGSAFQRGAVWLY